MQTYGKDFSNWRMRANRSGADFGSARKIRQ